MKNIKYIEDFFEMTYNSGLLFQVIAPAYAGEEHPGTNGMPSG